MITAIREHEICMGHRVYGHESKCSNLHGHNYRFIISAKPKNGLDSVGRVVDFSEIKSVLCEWLESNWDHKTILYENDTMLYDLMHFEGAEHLLVPGIIVVPFNPTAENIARYFLNSVCPSYTRSLTWYVSEITLYETSKCFVKAVLSEDDEKIYSVYDINNLPF